MSELLIELEAVAISREETETVALPDVTWQIREGEFWAVAGELAVGRTALLETAAGLTRGHAGQVRIFGQAVEDAGETEHLAWRQRIGFVFENGGRLLSQLTVLENVALPLLYHGAVTAADGAARARDLLETAGLGAVADRLPSRLSIIEQQRVAYLRAIASPKDVVFVDHPAGERWWMRVLGALHRDRQTNGSPITIVVTCGDFRGWRAVADRFAVVEAGSFQVIGDREQLLASSETIVQELR